MAPAFFYFLHPELYAEGSSSDCFMVARDVNGNKPDAVKKDSTAGDHPAVLPAYRKLISGLKSPWPSLNLLRMIMIRSTRAQIALIPVQQSRIIMIPVPIFPA